ncbi:hypothetical protein RSSL_01741 [Streptococcus salivarius K12]|uniref:Uncharacterized protein n=1 Tax=Streptococcus salivarius K12 TaxID=1200793 RepID=J7TQH5_STRSL|nr:hypothetical protein RSSL_01741 [Streptococcus salivarius K12]
MESVGLSKEKVEQKRSPSAFFKELKLYYSHPNKYY